MMDVVLKLRELRRRRNLSQKDAARLSGIGEKTISSFETGERIDSLKLSQLGQLLEVYGISAQEFFGDALERELAPWEMEARNESERVLEGLELLPKSMRNALLEKFHLMVETAAEVQTLAENPQNYAPGTEWQMLTSRN